MTRPFRGTINVDDRDSVPDWEPYLQPKAPDGAPNVLYIVLDDVGLLGDGAVGRPDRDAQHQRARGRRPHVHKLAHHGPVLAHPFEPAHRTQPHDERDGVYRGGHERLPELERPHPLRVRHDRRGAGRARLEHLHARQVASRRVGRDEPGVDEAQLAGRQGVRAVLRLPRRRDEPVVPGPDLRQPPGGAARDPGGRGTTSRPTSRTRRSSSSRTRR